MPPAHAFLVCGGFGGGMHAVLRDFVDAASGRLDLLAEEMIQRQTAFPNGIGFLYCFGHIDFGKRDSFEESPAGC